MTARARNIRVGRLRAAVAREIAGLDPGQIHPWIGAQCLAGIVVAIGLGLATGQHAAGAIACGGAFTAGAGVYQRFARSQLAPMLVVTLAIGLSTFVGTLAGAARPTLALVLLIWGLLAGLLADLGGGWQWVGQQSAIFLLVAANFPGSNWHALLRGVLVIGGGLSQVLLIELQMRFQDVTAELVGWSTTRSEFAGAFARLVANLQWRARGMQFAMRVAAVLVTSEVVATMLRLRNGYWVGMTALLVLRAEFRETWRRGLSRVGGTIGGILLAMLMVHLLHPGSFVLALLVALFAYLSYSFQQYSYALFAAFLTAYIVFLLAFAGLDPPKVAHYRLLGTCIGAVLAIAAHMHLRLQHRAVTA